METMLELGIMEVAMVEEVDKAKNLKIGEINAVGVSTGQERATDATVSSITIVPTVECGIAMVHSIVGKN